MTPTDHNKIEIDNDPKITCAGGSSADDNKEDVSPSNCTEEIPLHRVGNNGIGNHDEDADKIRRIFVTGM